MSLGLHNRTDRRMQSEMVTVKHNEAGGRLLMRIIRNSLCLVRYDAANTHANRVNFCGLLRLLRSTREKAAVRVMVSLAVVATILMGYASAQSSRPSSGSASNASAGNTSSQSPNAGTPAVAKFLNASNKNAMKITLTVSRQQAVAGSDFGITATIENISATPIYFVPGAFSMTLPPEIDSGGPRDWLAFFPGIIVPPNQSYEDTVIVLEPGSNISAFWAGQRSTTFDVSPPTTTLGKLWGEFGDFTKALTFSPGQYSLAIVGSYWDTHEGAQLKSVEHHTQTAAVIETITAPQKVVLLGAAIGGLIAFLLLSRLYPTGAWANVRLMTGFISSVLLSTIVTILLSRLSQSQFIVQVTVNDFWGAMAVGFLITAAGPAVLQRFIGLVSPAQTGTSARPLKGQRQASKDSGASAETSEPVETAEVEHPGQDMASSLSVEPNGNKHLDPEQRAPKP